MSRLVKRILRAAPPAMRLEIEREGWTAEKTESNHIRWKHPKGALVFSASTPSDHRAWRNTIGELRRATRDK